MPLHTLLLTAARGKAEETSTLDARRLLDQLAGVGPRDALDRTERPCGQGLVIITLGQSNAANSGAGRHRAKTDVVNFNPYDGKCYGAADPLLGTDGLGGNFATRLGDLLIERGFASRVILIPIAISGTAVVDWTRSGRLSLRVPIILRRLRAAGLSPTHILWHQGEADQPSTESEAGLYSKNLREVVAAFRDDGILAPFYVALTSFCSGYAPGHEHLREAQRRVVSVALGIFQGPDTDLIGPEYRHDGCHMAESGLARHAEAWAQVLMR